MVTFNDSNHLIDSIGVYSTALFNAKNLTGEKVIIHFPISMLVEACPVYEFQWRNILKS